MKKMVSPTLAVLSVLVIIRAEVTDSHNVSIIVGCDVFYQYGIVLLSSVIC